MKKIIIVTPKFPYPPFGACEQDRAAGIELFIKNGWEVRVFTKIYNNEYQEEVDHVAKKLGIKIIAVPYQYLNKNKKGSWRRWLRPRNWDGSAFEYADITTRDILNKELQNFRPDFVWFDYTYLWPLYDLVKKYNIPIVTRSINFEPTHFLDEDGRTWWNYLKILPKLFSEYLVVKKSDIIFSITPKEALIYRKFGHKKVFNLPLRGLFHYLEQKHIVRDKNILNVFFAGSTYNVSHNRAALEFLVKEVIPCAEHNFPGQFIFHIFGKKLPVGLKVYCNQSNITYHQYADKNTYEFLVSEMDIALVPSLYGAGMQQKIFEPLARGFPTITSQRGLKDYPFEDKSHLLLASSVEEYVNCLKKLQNIDLRVRLSNAAKDLSLSLFSQSVIEKIIFNSI